MHPAYVAGFIDADGCISVSYKTVAAAMHGKKVTDRATYFNISVYVVQKEMKVVKAFCKQYGGRVSIVKRDRFTYYRWGISGKAVISLLESILPYIVEKKEQTEIALEAAKHQAECGRGRYRAGCEGTQPLSEHDLEYRKAMWLRMKELNTCHKSRAAATTKSNDPEKGSDSLNSLVIARGAAKAPSVQHVQAVICLN